MKFPRIEAAYNIVFNNTGFGWAEIQNAVCEIIEKKYRVLHQIGKKYHEELGVPSYEIKGVRCLLYFKVNLDTLCIDVVAIKEDNRHINDEEGGEEDA